MITIEIQGQGKFTIPTSKLGELMNWITQNAMHVEGIKRPLHGDDILLNE